MAKGQLSLLEGGAADSQAESVAAGDDVAVPPAAVRVLAEVFGHRGFRVGQAEAIAAVLDDRDAVVLLPTGGGKSLCYQVPAVALSRDQRGCTVVVSPLLALMHDQVRALCERGVAAAALNSTLSADSQHEVRQAMMAGELELLYVSPERAAQLRFRKDLARTAVALLAIDEAHCVSQWGHDFRPEYLRLHELRRHVECPVIALTATATRRVLAELVERLELQSPAVVTGAFVRENLEFSVAPLSTDAQRIDRLSTELSTALASGGRAIVYCSTRKKTQVVAAALKKRGFAAGYYHAGRTALARERAERAFAQRRTPVLVATNAFGMGVDFPDVRLLVHFQSPGSVEAYYQEAGRAGRDGAPARCVLFFSKRDLVTQRRLMMPRGTSAAMRRRAEAALEALVAYVSTAVCRQQAMSAYFGVDELPAACGRCDNCLGVTEALELSAPSTRPAGSEASGERPRPEASEALLDATLDAVAHLARPTGRANLARALRGSKAKSVKRLGLQHMPSYGALSEHAESEVLSALDVLLRRGTLELRGRKYPKLWLAGRAMPGRGAGSGAGSKRRAAQSELARQLENYRRRTARRLKWKPYMVFHRKVIKAVEKHQPTTLDDLLRIPGLGEAKVERFGEDILAVVRSVSS